MDGTETTWAMVLAAVFGLLMYMIERSRPLVAAIMELLTERVIAEMREIKRETASRESVDSLRIEVAQFRAEWQEFKDDVLAYREEREQHEKEQGNGKDNGHANTHDA